MVNVYRVHWFSREEMIAKDLSFKDTCFSSLFPPVFGPRTETQIKQHQQHWLHCGVYIYIHIYISCRMDEQKRMEWNPHASVFRRALFGLFFSCSRVS